VVRIWVDDSLCQALAMVWNTGGRVFLDFPLVGWCVDRAVSSRVSVVVTFQ